MTDSVSVITRTKDRPLLLARCIESLLAQDYTSWTHVIVNDGGPVDEVAAVTQTYIQAYGSRLALLNHAKSLGMEAASNTALRACRSDFVVFLDDDDTWHPQFLSKMIDAFVARIDKRTKGIVCQTEIVTEKVEDGRLIELNRSPFNDKLETVSLTDLLIQNRFTNNAFLFRREAADEVGMFDEHLPVLGDWDFNIRFAMRFEISVLPEILARWHWRERTESYFDNTQNNVHQLWYNRLVKCTPFRPDTGISRRA
jgi:glycosyltransferase involved in cell wall biosynthesis